MYTFLLGGPCYLWFPRLRFHTIICLHYLNWKLESLYLCKICVLCTVAEIFLLNITSRPELGPTKPFKRCLSGDVSRGLGQGGQSVQLTILLHLVTRLRMPSLSLHGMVLRTRGANLPFYHYLLLNTVLSSDILPAINSDFPI
jgi:hypothetical protein